jgi:ABC-type uncharacterized transport system permease subunit
MGVLSGISVVCFGASYSVALLLEISRLFVQVPARTIVMIGFAAAGFFAHTLFMAFQIRQHQADEIPVVTWYTGCLILAWVLVLTYLMVFAFGRQATAGLLLLPAAVVMIVVAHLFPSTPRAVRVWNQLHGLSLLLGMAMVVMGFVAGLMYLFQSYRLKQKLPPRSKTWLPSLERLESINERCLLISVAMLGLGLISGILLNLVRAGSDRVIPWTDPVVLASFVWLTWLLAVVLFHAFYRPARQGRKVAYMTISSFAFLSIVLAIIWWMPSPHTERPSVSDRRADSNRVAGSSLSQSLNDLQTQPPLVPFRCGRQLG